MGDIKSALEIALEKVEQLGEVTEEERLKWKYVPKGEELASRYLKGDCNLITEMSKYKENETKYIIEGASEILIRNINLPKNNAAKSNNKKAMDGLKTLKTDKVSTENVYSRIRNLFNHYTEQGEQQRKGAFQALKADFEAKVQQAVQQQLGTLMGAKVDVEKLPQFQQEWHRIHTQLDSQYLSHLSELKRELSSIT